MAVEQKVGLLLVGSEQRTVATSRLTGAVGLGLRHFGTPWRATRSTVELARRGVQAVRAVGGYSLRAAADKLDPETMDAILEHGLKSYEKILEQDPVMVSSDVDGILERYDDWERIVDSLERWKGRGRRKRPQDKIIDFAYVMDRSGIVHRPDDPEGQREQQRQIDTKLETVPIVMNYLRLRCGLQELLGPDEGVVSLQAYKAKEEPPIT